MRSCSKQDSDEALSHEVYDVLMQAVMDHSHAMSGQAFGGNREDYSRSPGALSQFTSKPRKKGPMRPSMELRHRQLDLSLLQVGCSNIRP